MQQEHETPSPEDLRPSDTDRATLDATDQELPSRDRAESGAPAAGHAIRDLFSTDEIFQRVIATADEEVTRSVRLLFFSGLAAGFSIGLSFIARSAMTVAVPGGSRILGIIFYPLGFLLIVMGRYQLFTENTLTPVSLVLTRIVSIPVLVRIWTIVLTANTIGAAATACVLATTGVFSPEASAIAGTYGEHLLEIPLGDLFWKAVVAGWIVASMVWLTHAARESTTRFLIVFAVMAVVPAADLVHCIIGACEVLYVYVEGGATLAACGVFFLVTVAGNTVGGVLLVAILNYSQTRDARFPDTDWSEVYLDLRSWLFGFHIGTPRFPKHDELPEPERDSTSRRHA